MVKRFVDDVQFRPTDPTTGAAAGQMALAQRLEQFADMSRQIAQREATERGVEEAQQVELQRDEEGRLIQPQKREMGLLDMLIGGAESKSYNRTLQSAYLASLSNDIRQNIGQIENESGADLTTFNDKMTGYVAGTLNTVDPSIRNQVAQYIQGKATNARLRVQGKNIAANIEAAETARTTAIEGATSEAIRAAREGDQVTASESLIETRAMIQSFVGEPGFDQAAADHTFNQVQKRVAVEGLRSKFRQEAQKPGGAANAAESLLTFREKPLRGFSVDEQEDIYKTLVTDLNQTMSLVAKSEKAEDDGRKSYQAENSSALYLGVLNGWADATDIQQALLNKRISQAQAEKLINTVNNSGFGVNDWTLINSIENDIRNDVDPETIRAAITDNTGVRLQNDQALQLTQKLNQSLDQESPLKTSEARRAEDFIISSMRVVGPMGAFDTEAERRLATARREYADAVLAGEDPFAVADRLVDKDSFTRLPNPKFGSKSDLDASLIMLNEAFAAGSVDDDTYNREVMLIDELKRLQQSTNDFNAAKKDHENGLR